MIHVLYDEGGEYLVGKNGYGICGDIAYGGELNGTKLYGHQRLREDAKRMAQELPLSDASGDVSATITISRTQKFDITNGLTFIFDPINGIYPRELSIGFYSVSDGNFTNLFPKKSLSRDRSGMYNGIGYGVNVYLDDNAEEARKKGYALTGLIPLIVGQTVRIQGADFTAGENAYVFVYFFDAGGNYIKRVGRNNFIGAGTSDWGARIDEYGTLSFKPQKYYTNNGAQAETKIDEMRYIAFGFVTPEDWSKIIVTVNEPITYGSDETYVPYESWIGSRLITGVNSPVFYQNLQQNGINKITIKASDIKAPHTRYRLSNVFNGKMTLYEPEDVIDCLITGEMDVLSRTMPTGTCDITLSTGDVLVHKPEVRQRLEVYHNGDLRGVYFAEAITRAGKNRYLLTCHDMIGEMDLYPFYGDIYNDVPVAELIQSIHAAAALPIVRAEAMPDNVTKLSGNLPVTTCREALRMVLQAAGWTADASKSATIRYLAPELIAPEAVLETNLVAIGERIKDSGTVQGVKVETYRYINPLDVGYSDRTVMTYTSDEYGKGYKPIVLLMEQPSVKAEGVQPVTLMDGTTANRFLVDGTVYRTVVDENGVQTSDNIWSLQVYPYIVRQSTVTADGSSEIGTIGALGGNTMISPELAQNVADRAFAWLRRKEILTAKLVGDYNLGDTITAVLTDDVPFTGTITYCRYRPVGGTIIMEVDMRGIDY